MLAMLFTFGSTFGIAGNTEQDQSTTSITGATLIDGTGAQPLENAVIIVRGGSIECIGGSQQCSVDTEAEVLDATGKWLVPGFIDSHVHWQVWFNRQKTLSRETAANAARVYLANGITTLVDVGAQRWVTGANRQVLDELQASGKPAPRIFYAGWIDRKEIEVSDSKDAGSIARDQLANGAIGIKIHNGLTKQDYRRIAKAADDSGHPVFGHSYYINEDGFLNLTPEALDAGVDGIFHILGIPPVAPENRPPPPTEPMDDWQAWWLAGASLWLNVTDRDMDDLIRQMISRQAWLQPTLVTEDSLVWPGTYMNSPNWTYSPVTWEELQFGRPILEGEDLAQYRAAYAQMQVFVKRFYAAGGMLVAGTDGLPIPAFGLHDELRLLVQAGVPPQAALQSATRNAAMAMHLQDSLGTLQPGKKADLVVLNSDPLIDIENTKDIWRVIKSGMVYDPEDLLQ